MQRVNHVLVVGGGVGGMCAAICLARQGITVDLVEIKHDWNMLGAGLTFNSATLASFAKVGVGERIAAIGSVRPARPENTSPANTLTGGILRPALHGILCDAISSAGAKVRTGVTFESLENDDDAARVTFTDGTRGDYDLVIGADGLESDVRQTIFPDAPQPRFTGQGCWRAIFPRPPGYDGGMFGHNRTAGFNPVSNDEMYLYLLQSVPDNRWMPPEKWPELLGELLSAYDDPILRKVSKHLDANARINYRPLKTLMLPPPWYRGRVLLIGDAAHATTPHMAYGAGLAVEDAVVLSELVALGLPVSEMLERFMTRRYERCRTVVETSVAIGDFQLHPRSPERLQEIVQRAGAIMTEAV